MGGSAVGLFVEGGSVGLALGAVVLQHFQDLIDGIVGVVEDRHRLYCYFLLYTTPPLFPPFPLTSLYHLQCIAFINGRMHESHPALGPSQPEDSLGSCLRAV